MLDEAPISGSLMSAFAESDLSPSSDKKFEAAPLTGAISGKKELFRHTPLNLSDCRLLLNIVSVMLEQKAPADRYGVDPDRRASLVFALRPKQSARLSTLKTIES